MSTDMLRPRLRPTLSRKVKYLGIAPTAHKKLGKEARRGSFNLRKLVGHANFLDVLVNELDISDDEDGNFKIPQPQPKQAPSRAKPADDDGRLYEDEDTASDDDDAWSEVDSSDDEEHALVRTISGLLRQATAPAPAVEVTEGDVDDYGDDSSEDGLPGIVGRGNLEPDYFQVSHGEVADTAIAVDPAAIEVLGSVVDEAKKDAIISVVAAPAEMTPLPSPTEKDTDPALTIKASA